MKPPTEPILAAFAALVARRPQTPLVAVGDRRATAGDLDDLARSCAAALAGHGLESGDVVGLAAGNGPGFLAALVALRRAGCAALLLDASSPAVEKGRIVSRMGARGLLECAGGWPEEGGAFRYAASRLPAAELRNVGADVAVIKLTSGSTGRPQGILTSSASLVADDEALARTMSLGDDERILAGVPLSHSYGLSSIVMPALMRGSTVVVPDHATPVSPMLTLRRQEITFLPSVPAKLAPLVRLSAPPPLPDTLRRVVSAGAPLPPHVATRFREIFGRPVHVFYGSSECGGICYDREGSAGEMGSVGTPVEGVRVTLDPAGANDRGGEGAVCVESPAVAGGYFPDPDSRLDNGRFRSRDLGRWDDGRLVLAGRIDDLINVRGKNVNPREVEEILTQVEGVDEVAAFGVPAPHDEGEMLRAVIACAPGRLDEPTLREWCRRHLADYKVPRSLVLVERLPRTERGKLDRAALRSLRGAKSP